LDVIIVSYTIDNILLQLNLAFVPVKNPERIYILIDDVLN